MSKRLYRSREDAILGGVAGGLAKYFGVDVVVVRLLIVLAAFLFPTGSVIVAYIIAWLIIPLEPKTPEKVETRSVEKPVRTGGAPSASCGISSESDKVQAGASSAAVQGQVGEARDVSVVETGIRGPAAEESRAKETVPTPTGSKAEVRPPELIKGDAVKVSRDHDTATRQFLGWALMIIGAILLVRRLAPPLWWQMPFRVVSQWWPLSLVALGVVIVISALRR
ncbi:MAG: PspC domain-containing protein [Firmicutes bacterium]|nr:PspC domain-containing protein [Candidatus Fermentithermobacillaceae bacterium]